MAFKLIKIENKVGLPFLQAWINSEEIEQTPKGELFFPFCLDCEDGLWRCFENGKWVWNRWQRNKSRTIWKTEQDEGERYLLSVM